MAEVFKLPYEYVSLLTTPGLSCGLGSVPLQCYLSSTLSNGGSDSSQSLIENIRSKLRDGGSGATLQSMYGGGLDRIWRGCGDPAVISGVWKFLCRNKEQLKSVHVEVFARRAKSAPGTRVKRFEGKVHKLYFEGRSDAAAIKQMVADRFFGQDCIGFLGTYMIWAGELGSYPNTAPSAWPTSICKINIDQASQVKPLDFLCWDGHVAIVDWVWGMVDNKTVEVDVCQSSGIGPQCNLRVQLRQTLTSHKGGRQFKILHRGTPAMPVHDRCIIQRRADFRW